jgi:hypothetical protein
MTFEPLIFQFVFDFSDFIVFLFFRLLKMVVPFIVFGILVSIIFFAIDKLKKIFPPDDVV